MYAMHSHAACMARTDPVVRVVLEGLTSPGGIPVSDTSMQEHGEKVLMAQSSAGKGLR